MARFKKGQSGNPKGRPKNLPDLKELLCDILNKESDDGRTSAEIILDKIRKLAEGGNLKAAEMLMDRSYGKVKQDVDIVSKGEQVGQVLDWDKVPTTIIDEIIRHIRDKK